MTFTLQPIRVATGFDEEGMMVLDEERRLVAVLVRLSDENEVAPGQWYLEAGFGQIDGINHPIFSNLDMAKDWMAQRLTRGQ
ncbi:hypothetical protein [Microvirga lenta]|uniref:hypothetical protein n=1 Tax=Microvirga lenta TaxID=2881337 RepID=UPI001CFF7868|nr:hypothetical protein [Microvirga lenta]MCB5176907.1 hypothetical protein [Microvirga lenta]